MFWWKPRSWNRPVNLTSYVMITKEEVKKVAKLARLGLTEKEIVKYQKELSAILGYFEKLKEIDVSGVEPMSHSVRVENVMRVDVASEKRKAKSAQLTELMPETKNGYLKVKSILNGH
ncbi:MAG: aspartyl-tRNA(Asn)/glutamyl-tRNA (Gln) amidotransferase subunit C [Parcubacteria group bacterium Gr01-1014_30]|nr:MAG: aspartyl-tRNA(Asn)/glutamyl-tRNA (Gln) amidotransferase subunit C [Parcubacteria group bacterium Gr01-1014_30]